MSKRKKIVLAYSGGLDTSVAIRWLQEKYDADVFAVTLDLGQGKDLEGVQKKALSIGAKEALFLMSGKNFSVIMFYQLYGQVLFMKNAIP